MLAARAGRLPPTASVVDAVFDALEQEAPTSGLVGAIRKVRRNVFGPASPPKYVGFRGIEDYQEVENEGLGMDAESDEAQHIVGMYVRINLLSAVARKILCSADLDGTKKKALKELIKRLEKHEHEWVLRMRPGDLDYDSASRFIDGQVEVPFRSRDERKKIYDAVYYMIASDPSNYDD